MPEATTPAETCSSQKSNGTDSQPSKLQWNLIGWYGSSLGATVWMILTPYLLNWPVEGVVAGVVGTLIVWSYSAIAWGMRAQLSAFRGLIGLLSFTVLSNLAFLLFAHVNNLPLDEASNAIETNYSAYYTALFLLFVSLLTFFWLKEKQAQA